MSLQISACDSAALDLQCCVFVLVLCLLYHFLHIQLNKFTEFIFLIRYFCLSSFIYYIIIFQTIDLFLNSIKMFS